MIQPTAKLFLALQWLGWTPDWRRPAALRRDWLAEAQRAAAVLACSAGARSAS